MAGLSPAGLQPYRPLYIIFYTGFGQTIDYQDVYAVQEFLKAECGIRIPLTISQIHLAVDVVYMDKINFYNRMIRSIKAGKKGKPFNEYDTTQYFGILGSSNTLIVYDKGQKGKNNPTMKVK